MQVFRATLSRRFAALRGIVTIKRVRGAPENAFEAPRKDAFEDPRKDAFEDTWRNEFEDIWKSAFGETRTSPTIEEGDR